MTRGASAALGGVMALVTGVFYFLGAGRSIGDLDASVTVGAFVKTPSLMDALRRTLKIPGFEFNNHPLFSVVEHVVWSAGFHNETALRVPPILFAVVAVGLLASECGRRFGLRSGVCAGAVLAANPLFASLSRELRGYSLVVLCAVASTILFRRLLTARRNRVVEVGYVVLIAAGIATHLYFGLVLIGQAVFVIAAGSLSPRWVLRWTVSVTLGAAIYIRLARNMLSGERDGYPHPGFLTKSAHLLLGHQPLAVVVLFGFVLAAIYLSRKHRDAIIAISVVALIVAAMWLFVRPQYLAPRFVIWLVPFVGLAVAVVVSRRPWAASLVAVAVIAMIADQSCQWTTPSPALAQAAAIVDAARSRGLQVCGFSGGSVALLAYTRMPTPISNVGMKSCDLAVAMRSPTSEKEHLARVELPNIWELHGDNPIVVYSRIPIAEILNPIEQLPLDTHPRTYR